MHIAHLLLHIIVSYYMQIVNTYVHIILYLYAEKKLRVQSPVRVCTLHPCTLGADRSVRHSFMELCYLIILSIKESALTIVTALG